MPSPLPGTNNDTDDDDNERQRSYYKRVRFQLGERIAVVGATAAAAWQ